MVSAGIVSRDGWIEMMEKTLLEVFTAGLDDDQEWKKIWTQKESTKRREEAIEFSRPDVVVETPEGAPYVELTTEKIRAASVVHADYTGMIRITHQMQRDKKYDEMEDKSWGLGESINRKLYEEAVRMYYEGFAGGGVLAPDAKAVFASDHPCDLATGETWSNLLTPASLDDDAVNDGQVLMMETKNEHGKITPYGTKNLQLIVPAKLRRQGKRLAMTGEYAPGSPNFDKLIHELDVICLPMLAQAPSAYRDTQFYLRDAKKAMNYCFTREGPTFDMLRDPLTDDVIVKARIAFSFLWVSARGVVGCKGA
jgi:hypothetical protein